MLAGAAALLLVGGAVGWSATTLLAPPQQVPRELPFTYATAREGSVGSTISVTAVASWARSEAGANRATGTVTSSAWTAGAEAHSGDTLYAVDQRPVIVAAGAVPAYRDLAVGDSGDDVSQLQTMLAQLGHGRVAVDGAFTDSTRRGVRAWQKSLGVEPTGVVGVGDIVYVPTLPARLTVDPKVIKRGAVVSGGEPAVQALAEAPRFTAPVTTTQAGAMHVGAGVAVAGGGSADWPARIERVDMSADEVELVLAAVDGGAICADECGNVAVSGDTLFAAVVTTVEPVEGTVVPAAALRTRADGSLDVTDRRGKRHDVEVLATARGMAAVSGITPGLVVRVPGDG